MPQWAAAGPSLEARVFFSSLLLAFIESQVCLNLNRTSQAVASKYIIQPNGRPSESAEG